MGFGITITAALSTRTNSPQESEKILQIGLWSPKKKCWMSYRSVGEGKTPVKIDLKFPLKELVAMLKSNVTLAIIYTTCSAIWWWNYFIYSDIVSAAPYSIYALLAILSSLVASYYWLQILGGGSLGKQNGN